MRVCVTCEMNRCVEYPLCWAPIWDCPFWGALSFWPSRPRIFTALLTKLSCKRNTGGAEAKVSDAASVLEQIPTKGAMACHITSNGKMLEPIVAICCHVLVIILVFCVKIHLQIYDQEQSRAKNIEMYILSVYPWGRPWLNGEILPRHQSQGWWLQAPHGLVMDCFLQETSDFIIKSGCFLQLFPLTKLRHGKGKETKPWHQTTQTHDHAIWLQVTNSAVFFYGAVWYPVWWKKRSTT